MLGYGESNRVPHGHASVDHAPRPFSWKFDCVGRSAAEHHAGVLVERVVMATYVRNRGAVLALVIGCSAIPLSQANCRRAAEQTGASASMHVI